MERQGDSDADGSNSTPQLGRALGFRCLALRDAAVSGGGVEAENRRVDTGRQAESQGSWASNKALRLISPPDYNKCS